MKSLKRFSVFVIACVVLTYCSLIQKGIVTSAAYSDVNNGDWTSTKVIKYNTSEAEVMVRAGDIDNFGYPWNSIDPFTGKETQTHGYPFKPQANDPVGTDRIMVVSGYNGGSKTDGYTSATYGKNGYNTTVAPVTLTYDLKGRKVYNAYIQMFVDDIQPSKWVKIDGKWVNMGRGGYSKDSYTQYQVTLTANNKTVRVSEFETVINNLDQHGPIGKMITLKVPDEYIEMIQNGGSGLSIKIDDPRKTVVDINNKSINNTGDGYAIDFVKLLVNKNDGFTQYDAAVHGKVYEAKYVNNELVLDKSKPIGGVKISISGVKDVLVTDSSGAYSSTKVPAGQVVIQAEKDGYAKAVYTIPTLQAKDVYTQDIGLINLTPPDMPIISLNPENLTNTDVIATITYPGDLKEKKYRIDGGEWKDYNGPITIESNCLLEAQSQENVKISPTEIKLVESSRASRVISNIDKFVTGTVNVSYSGIEGYLDLVLYEPNVTILPPPSVIEYEGNTYNVVTEADGDKIYLDNILVAKISTDGTRVTCYRNFEYTFKFRDKAGNVGSASGDSKIPMQDR
ncbi:carboxypeptidase-like regulatory domain-containing protein [Clostridium thermarum]|uniref:carboxypeptidase-like regulatory domain-containing protein n=1 Tax=Clostridium thermarum TaxID=1716543 RepID=UPI0013D7828D|nr:carboxypeptidase-like regulatory domain-containing protein [Clostridium thermarum]